MKGANYSGCYSYLRICIGSNIPSIQIQSFRRYFQTSFVFLADLQVNFILLKLYWKWRNDFFVVRELVFNSL